MRQPGASCIDDKKQPRTVSLFKGVYSSAIACPLVTHCGTVAVVFVLLSVQTTATHEIMHRPHLQILIVVVLEHIILASKIIIDLAVPDVPHWIRIETAKQEHYRREAFKVSLPRARLV